MPNSWWSRMIRSQALQRTTPSIAGIGPSSTRRARNALCSFVSLPGAPGDALLMRPSGPCSLKPDHPVAASADPCRRSSRLLAVRRPPTPQTGFARGRFFTSKSRPQRCAPSVRGSGFRRPSALGGPRFAHLRIFSDVDANSGTLALKRHPLAFRGHRYRRRSLGSR